MFKRVIFAVSGALFLTLLVLSMDAQAIPMKAKDIKEKKINGKVWVAQHIQDSKWYLVIEPDKKIKKNSVIKAYLNEIELFKSDDPLDFSELTKKKDILYYGIDKISDFNTEELVLGLEVKHKKKIDIYKGTAKLAKFNNPPENGPTQLPEPTTLLLVGIGLIGLAAFRRKKFKKV